MSDLALFEAALKNRSEATFYISHSQTLSYSAFFKKVSQAAQWLKNFPLEKVVGEKPLVLLDIQDPQTFLILSFACFSLNWRPAFLNLFFKDAQIADLTSLNKYALALTDTSKTIPNTQTCIIPAHALDKYRDESFDLKIPLDSEMVFFSSGSVQTKACVLTLQNLFYNALGSAENIPFSASDVWGASLPLFHVGGFSVFVRALLAKGKVFHLKNETSLFEQIQKNKITHLSLVSTQFIRLIDEFKLWRQPLGALKYLLLGGSSMAAHHIQDGLDLGLPILKSYGMTEMGSQICTTGVLQDATESSGQVLKYRKLKVVAGEILVRGPCLFAGYLSGNQLLPSRDADGWFATHDLGSVVADELIVSGRRDRIFQSGGENISPEQIEKALLKLDGIEKVFVLPEEDSVHGLRAVAYIEKLPTLSQSAIDDFLKVHLSGLMRPKEFRSWDALPKKSWKLQ